ncbi:MAG: hypothetical protein Q8P23_00910 [bacterium]|nr:hypothetical protein [bacterium]
MKWWPFKKRKSAFPVSEAVRILDGIDTTRCDQSTAYAIERALAILKGGYFPISNPTIHVTIYGGGGGGGSGGTGTESSPGHGEGEPTPFPVVVRTGG